jgi:hypothetical protein
MGGVEGVDVFFGAFAALMLLAFAGILVAALIGMTEPWRERRALVRLARTYGIEYVPGEDLGALRAKVLQRRDAGAP